MSPFIQIKLANPQLRKGQGKSAVSVFFSTPRRQGYDTVPGNVKLNRL